MPSLFELRACWGFGSEWKAARGELGEHAVPDGADASAVRGLRDGEQDVPRAGRPGGVRGQDEPRAVLQLEQVLAAPALAALGAVLAVHLDDVQGVVDHGRVRYGASDAVCVADGV